MEEGPETPSPARRLDRLRQRLIRSAENSPRILRRPLRLPHQGLLSCSGSETTSPREMATETDASEAASLPPTPTSLRKKGGVSRKQKIWRSLKRGLGSRRGEEADRLCRSQPDLHHRRSDPQPSHSAAHHHDSHQRLSHPPRPASPNHQRHSRFTKFKSMLSGRESAGSVERLSRRETEEMGPVVWRRDSVHSGQRVGFAAAATTSGPGGREARTLSQTTSQATSGSDATLHRHGPSPPTAHRTKAEDGGSAPFVTFLLQVHLRDGRDLVIRDASGTSDPYVKFKHRGKLVYKSNTVFKNLNPVWDEKFEILIDDPTSPLELDVFDYDRFAMDDFMGAAAVDLAQFRFWEPTDLKVLLGEEGSEQYMGFLDISLSIAPQTQDEKDEFLKKTVRSTSETAKKPPNKAAQVWTSVVNVTLVEGKNFLATELSSSAPLPDPYVKFKLGSEKHKSRPVAKSLDPKWLERFDMHVFEDSPQLLELTVLDKRKDVFMGRVGIDLAALEREIPHQRWWELEDEAGAVYLQITISGTHGTDSVGDLAQYDPVSEAAAAREAERRYALHRSLDDLRDVGQLRVKVFKAQGLASADIGGKSDPFAVLELVNARLQTHTVYKSLNPEWGKVFTFSVKDIHSSLEVTVYDEDPNKKAEFLGKVAVPLLKIRNSEKRWYALKDRKLRKRAKGQILMEMEVVFNPVRASIRTFNPREIKFIPQQGKFKRALFLRSVNRIKEFGEAAAEGGAFIKSCWAWESAPRSILSYGGFCVTVYFFQLYMVPLGLLLLFGKGALFRAVQGSFRQNSQPDHEYFDTDEEDDNTDDKEEKRSLKERLGLMQDTLVQVQDVLEMVAAMFERVKNTFNFTTPFLSYLAVFVLTVASVGLYFVPLRYLLLVWGTNKWTKKLRNPNALENNELLDFLSRVPSDTEIRLFGEFRPDPVDRASVRRDPRTPAGNSAPS